MSDEEFNPLEDVLYAKKNQSNISIRSIILERKNISVYMYPNIYKAFSQYSKFTGKIKAVCVEEALIEYMRTHPVDQVTLQVTKDMRSFLPSLSDKLKLKIIKNKLGKKLDLTIRLYQKGNEYDIQDNLESFQKIIEKALRIKNPDPELTELLRKSEEYL